MALQARWTDEAKLQFKEILEYWDENNGSSAYSEKLINLVDTTVSRLVEYPEIGRRTDNQRIKLKIVKNYFLYYSFDEDTLTILGVSDMRRDPDYLNSMLNVFKMKG